MSHTHVDLHIYLYESERCKKFTNEGVKRGAGAARTGAFLIRRGGLWEEEPSLEKTQAPRVGLFREVDEGLVVGKEREVRHHPCNDAVDIVRVV